MLTFIGILLYITAVILFSEIAPPKSTNWSIFYFSSVFIGFLLISIDKAIYSVGSFSKRVMIVSSMFFLIMLIQQLTLINKPYDYYMESVNDVFIDTVKFLLISIVLLIISIKYLKKWGKISKK